MIDKLLTLPEVASLLRLSNGSVYNLVNAGKLPALKIGRSWRFKVDQISIWMTQQSPNFPNFTNSANN